MRILATAMAQRSLDRLGVGLQLSPAGYMLVPTAWRHVSVAGASQGDVVSAIPGYLEAA